MPRPAVGERHTITIPWPLSDVIARLKEGHGTDTELVSYLLDRIQEEIDRSDGEVRTARSPSLALEPRLTDDDLAFLDQWPGRNVSQKLLNALSVLIDADGALDL